MRMLYKENLRKIFKECLYYLIISLCCEIMYPTNRRNCGGSDTQLRIHRRLPPESPDLGRMDRVGLACGKEGKIGKHVGSTKPCGDGEAWLPDLALQAKKTFNCEKPKLTRLRIADSPEARRLLPRFWTEGHRAVRR